MISNDLLITLIQQIFHNVLKVVISEMFAADITFGISINNLCLLQSQCRVSIIVHFHQKMEHFLTCSGVCYISHIDYLHFLHSNLNMTQKIIYSQTFHFYHPLVTFSFSSSNCPYVQWDQSFSTDRSIFRKKWENLSYAMQYSHIEKVSSPQWSLGLQQASAQGNGSHVKSLL